MDAIRPACRLKVHMAVLFGRESPCGFYQIRADAVRFACHGSILRLVSIFVKYIITEVSALTIPGHVTIYRYEPEGLPEQRWPPVWVSGSTPRWPIPSSYVRSFTCSERRLTDVVLKEKYESAQTVLVLAGGGGCRDSGRVFSDAHEDSRRFRQYPYIAGQGRLQRCLGKSGSRQGRRDPGRTRSGRR